MNGFVKAMEDGASVISVIASGVAAWAAWSLRQLARAEVQKIVAATEKRLQDQVDEADREIGAHRDRLTKVETRLDDFPSKADLARLEGAIGEVKAAAARTEDGISRLEGYFLSKGVAGA